MCVPADPYHTAGQANGMAFSCEETPLQPSLRNILTEVARDSGAPVNTAKLQSGDLSPWAQQGVLLLNWTLTVASNRAASHKTYGWSTFTAELVRQLSAHKTNLVFMLWGKHAHDAQRHITNTSKHLILKASHPSPYSYDVRSASAPAFQGCSHFQSCNEYICQNKGKPIVWT
jgi:uracil-DNA glycosylase